MRITTGIANFKNLRDFTISFDAESFTTVIVGENGVGKSKILNSAGVIILRDLDLKWPPAFAYRLLYSCRGHEIEVTAYPTQSTPARQVSIQDGQTFSHNKFVTEGRDLYLPKYVFGYYSCPSNRLEEHFELHQQRFYRALLDGDEHAARPLLPAMCTSSLCSLVL